MRKSASGAHASEEVTDAHESMRHNNQRRQRRLGKLTPVEFELAFAANHAA